MCWIAQQPIQINEKKTKWNDVNVSFSFTSACFSFQWSGEKIVGYFIWECVLTIVAHDYNMWCDLFLEHKLYDQTY